VELAQAKKAFLWVMTGAIGITALLAIGTLLTGGHISDREGKLLLTTLLLGVSSGLGLAAGAAWEKAKALAGATVCVAGLSFFVALLPIWTEIGRDSSRYGRLAGALYTLSGSGAYAGLIISRGRESDSSAIVVWRALGLVGLGLLTLLILSFLAEDHIGAGGARLLGALGIFAVASTLISLLMQRAQGEPAKPPALDSSSALLGHKVVGVEQDDEGTLVVLDNGTRLPLRARSGAATP
jgi:hypothetical protein